MVMQYNNSRRDTLGRALPAETSDRLNDAQISGQRDSVRREISLRFDDRKGAVRLNDPDFGRNKSNGQAPLDGMRINHDVGLRVGERLFPQQSVEPGIRGEVLDLFKNPAVARAFLVNPQRVIEEVCVERPHLRSVLEREAPFAVRNGRYEVNTQSTMYQLVKSELDPRVRLAEGSLYRAIDALLSSPIGRSLGGSAGLELASYKLMRDHIERGGLTVSGSRAERLLHNHQYSKRAIADLGVVSRISHDGRVPSHAPPMPTTISTSLPPAVTPPPTLVTPPQPVLPTFEPPRALAPTVNPAPQFKVVEPPPGVPVAPSPQLPAGLKVVSPPTIAPPVTPPASPSVSAAPQPSAELTPTMQELVTVVNTSTLDRRMGSPRSNPGLRFSEQDRETLTTMLTDPVVKNKLLSYSDAQLKGAFEAVRPDRIKYLEEWLSEKHREAVNYPGIALSVAGVTAADTNRIGQVVEIAREVARQKTSH